MKGGGSLLKGGGESLLLLILGDEFNIYKKLERNVLDYSTVPSPSIS